MTELDTALSQFFSYIGDPLFWPGVLGLAIVGYIVGALIERFLL